MARNTKQTTDTKSKIFTASKVGFYMNVLLTFLCHVPIVLYGIVGNNNSGGIAKGLAMGLVIWLGTLFSILCVVCFILALLTDKKKKWPGPAQILLLCLVVLDNIVVYSGDWLSTK